jgi:energy-coupling factor transporter ATP-binding protein EcfA2
MAFPGEDLDGTIPALRGVAEALGSFRLNHSGADAGRRDLRSRIRDYLVPRLLDPDSALVVAVVGGSGSGKSTLLNSLARRRISPSGPLRPTTAAPLVWTGEGLPPTLGGFPALLAGRGLVSDPAPPEGLILVDTPPPAIAGEDGRPAAIAVLEAADACMFVASGIRYADASGWELIDLAARRSLPALFVLNRLPAAPDIQRLLEDDFTRRLVARGVLADPGARAVIGVAEGPILPETGGLPPEWVSGVRKELEALADPLARRRAVARVAGAALRQVRSGLDAVRAGLVDEAVAALALSDAVDGGYRTVAADLAGALQGGRLADLAGEAPGALAAVVVRRCSLAARTVAAVWEAQPAGTRLLGDRPELWAHGPTASEEAGRRVAAWFEGLGPLAAEACGRAWWRRRRARRQVEALYRMALDPFFRPEPGTVRHGTVLLRAAREARGRLAEAWREILDDDSARFRELLGPIPTGALLARLRLDLEGS